LKYSMYMCGTALLLIGMPNKVKYLAILYPVVQYSLNPYVAFLYMDGAYRTVARKKCIIKSVSSLGTAD
jgi:hypothetical protein